MKLSRSIKPEDLRRDIDLLAEHVRRNFTVEIVDREATLVYPFEIQLTRVRYPLIVLANAWQQVKQTVTNPGIPCWVNNGDYVVRILNFSPYGTGGDRPQRYIIFGEE